VKYDFDGFIGITIPDFQLSGQGYVYGWYQDRPNKRNYWETWPGIGKGLGGRARLVRCFRYKRRDGSDLSRTLRLRARRQTVTASTARLNSESG
jgi:hypothetical protein